MKKVIFINMVFVVLSVLVGCKTTAPKKEAPKSQLQLFSYSVGGGMEVSEYDQVSLVTKYDGSKMLILTGDRFDEFDTIEVGEEVFRKCDSIIHATKLYETEITAEHEPVALDESTSGFCVYYEDSNENFSGSWGEGLEEIIDYLKSLRVTKHKSDE